MMYSWPNNPKWTPMASNFRPRTISSLSSSPYTGMHKAFSLAQVWFMEATWNNQELAITHEIQAFLNQLEGPVHPVRMFDWWKRTPILLSTGNQPWDDGTFFDDGTGWQEGYTLSLMSAAVHGDRVVYVQGLPVSTECFRRGDLIGIKHIAQEDMMENYLYEVRYGVSSNALGQAAITIQPGLRGAAAANDVVTTYCPTLPMRLISDSDAVIQRSIMSGEGFTLKFVEDPL